MPPGFLGRADVAISERFVTPTSAGAAILEAPAQATPLPVDKFRESYVEIRDRESLALVTVIELLSPSNKSGRDRYSVPFFLEGRSDHLVSCISTCAGEKRLFPDTTVR